MTALISVEQFRKDAKAKRDPRPVFRVSLEPAADVEGASRTKRFCFSDGSIDRMGDTIDPAGWDLTDFTLNPVALWAHSSMDPPIGRASNVAVEGQRLMGDIEFAPIETYAFADTIFRLVDSKFISACSVGFLPVEYSFVENDPERGWGIDFKMQQLLEISLCPIPANPNALLEARNKGIDLRPLFEWAERTLDSGGMSVLPRADLEKLRKDAAMTTKRTPGKPRLRADDENPDDKPPEDKVQATCGRKADAECGLKDASECAIHGKAEDPGDKPDDKPDDEKRLRALLLRLLGGTAPVRREADPDDLPMEHHDAIRLAHKSMKTCKSFLGEAMGHYAKAMDLMGPVVEALNEGASNGDGDDDSGNGNGGGGNGDGDKPDDADKAAQLRRAAELRARIRRAA
jgi:HK97 family phage prohead protease